MKRFLLLLVSLIALVALVCLHELMVFHAKYTLTQTLREESQYPVTVESFRGFIPLGRIWLKDLQFMTRLPEGETVNWNVPAAEANLKLTAYLFGSIEIQGLDIHNAHWKASLPIGWDLEGNVDVQGVSTKRPPSSLGRDALWCERLVLTLPKIQGHHKGKSYDLLYQSSFEIAPLSVKGVEVPLPFDFGAEANLTAERESTRILAKGKHSPREKTLQTDIRLFGMGLPVLKKYLEIASLIPDFPKLNVSDWIEGGSASLQLRTDAHPDRVKGDVTLRLQSVKLGKEILESEMLSETLRPILDSIQSRQDPVQLGPVSFDENLVTPEGEAFDQIQRGMVAELIKNDPGAALKSGAKLLRDFFGK